MKLSQRILLEVEQAAGEFAKKHRYRLGDELRANARDVVRTANRAWRTHIDRGAAIAALSTAIDELKITLQLCQDIRAFSGFSRFEQLITVAHDLGRRCGGWQKKHPIGQSRPAHVPSGSASLLSARDASQGANP